MTMSKVAGCGAIALAMILVVGGCSSQSGNGGGVGGSGAGGMGTGGEGNHGGSGAGGMGTGGEGNHGGSGAGGLDAGSTDARDGSPDAIICCDPGPDPSRGGTVIAINAQLGGRRMGNAFCESIVDLFCSTNWRLEPDQYGCPIWRYDIDHSGNCVTGLDGAVYHVDASDGGNDVAIGN